ncbi:O-acyltransferase like protein-like isoform X1 [Euwallacea fornicatus]|uniref:O-acyltransferase like protein-like isoform X1 n=2 Tax=Euwallacea fornicatus TaxID=995702 RepID=UPI00338E8C27
MAGLKYFLLLTLLGISVESWKFYALNSSGSPKSNLTQPMENNAVISTENENLISTNREAQNRLSKIDFAQADTNDGKITEQKDMSAGKRIKSGEMKFESDAAGHPKVNGSKSPANTTRKPVKLNSKQGFIMNQILSTYGLNDVNNSLCKAHINEFKVGLRALEPWALRMFDASSKLMSGILGGNLAELGAWEQCLNVREQTASGLIKGRHCMLHVYPSDDLLKTILGFRQKISEKHFANLRVNVLEDLKIMWSVCVPDSCNHHDVLNHFGKLVTELGDGLNFTISLSEGHCTTIDDLPRVTQGDFIYLLCAGLVLATVAISTIADMLMAEDEVFGIINLFSLKRNAAALFSRSRSKNDIRCLHGIRLLSIYFIVYGHRFVHNLVTPVLNSMDFVDWLESYAATTIHGATTTVDTFIVVASTLVSYTYFTITSRGIKINILLFYLNRHLRLLAPFMLAIGCYITLTKHFGGGPLYHSFAKSFENSCSSYWWAALLNIQPFVNPRDICIVQTWFLSIDMFWYYMSPFLLIALARNQLTGYILLFSVYMGCTAVNFYVAWAHEFNGQMPVTPRLLSSDYFAYHYTQPVVRGGPYILGLVFGHALFRTKDQKVKISKITNIIGWIAASISMPFIVMITRSFRLEDFEYNRLYSSLFLATHRSVWSLGVIWIIWACHNGYGGLVNTFLSCDAFRILGRLGYNVFLFHYLFQSAVQNSKKAPTYFSHFLSTLDSMGDMLITLILSVPLTLCFEYPFNRMCGLVLRRTVPRSDNTIKVKPSDLNKKI